jgi:hypothetical protein
LTEPSFFVLERVWVNRPGTPWDTEAGDCGSGGRWFESTQLYQ